MTDVIVHHQVAYPGGWEVVSIGNDVHVLPVGDIRQHTMSGECWCCPDNTDAENMYTHQSADRREDFETGQRKYS